MEQLREMLREVLQVELAPIVGKIDILNGRVDGFESRFDRLETRFDGLETRMDGLESRMDGLENRLTGVETRLDGLDNQVTDIKTQLDRIETSQTEDVISMIITIDKKITARTDRHEHQINILNDRLLTVEADVRKLLLT